MADSPLPPGSHSSHGPAQTPRCEVDRAAEGEHALPTEEDETDRSISDKSVGQTEEWQAAPSSTTRSNPVSTPRRRIARFVLGRRLGRGSFGVVFRAHDPQLDRDVALKVCLRNSLGDERAIQRFLREARAAGQLRHPFIVPIHEAGRDGDTYFIASGLVEGETLERRLMAAPLSHQEAALLMARLAEAVDYAHRHGIVHRDIKPANILINQEGEPQLADFGMARLEQADELHTQDGSRLGTPAYMSPEQAGGDSHTADGRSDIWALGVVLYEMLTRRRPFVGDVSKIIHDILTIDPVRPRQVDVAIPRDLETICWKCLAKDPNERFATAAELADDLRRWLRGEPILSRSHSLAERVWRWTKRHPFPTAFIFTLIAGAVTSGVLAFQWRSQVAVANQQTNIATQATEKANQALRDTKLAQQSLAMRLAENLLSEGNAACELGRIDRGMLLFAEALRELPPSAATGEPTIRLEDLRFSIHANLRAWQPQLHVLEHVLPGATAALFTPDGSRIVTGGQGLQVWDAATGTLVGQELVAGGVGFLACDDAGRFAVSVGAVYAGNTGQPPKHILRRWDLTSLRQVAAEIDCGPDLQWTVASTDALRAATYHHKSNEPEGKLKFWRFDGSDAQVQETNVADPSSQAVETFNRDGSKLFVMGYYRQGDAHNAGHDTRLSVHDVLTGRMIASQSIGRVSDLRRLIVDGDMVALPGGKRSWRLSGEQLTELPGENAALAWRYGVLVDFVDETSHRVGNATGLRGQPLPFMPVDPARMFTADHTRLLRGVPFGLGVWRVCRREGSPLTASIYPSPDFDDIHRLTLWIEVATGWHRNPSGEFVQLSKDDWEARRKRLLAGE